MKAFKLEPALVLGAVQAALTLLVTFGLKLDAEKVAAILTLTATLLAVLTRQLVTPTAKIPTRLVVDNGPRDPVIPPAPKPPTKTDPPEAA